MNNAELNEKIEQDLLDVGAVISGHFVTAEGKHTSKYVNLRRAAHKIHMFDRYSERLHEELRALGAGKGTAIGIENLGRNIAVISTTFRSDPDAIWCSVKGMGINRKARFDPALDFGRLVKGREFDIFDDTLTSGGAIRLTAELITSLGGKVNAAAVFVRRTPSITAEDCGVPLLVSLCDMYGLDVYEALDCPLCKQELPVNQDVGRGREWASLNPNHPSAKANPTSTS